MIHFKGCLLNCKVTLRLDLINDLLSFTQLPAEF